MSSPSFLIIVGLGSRGAFEMAMQQTHGVGIPLMVCMDDYEHANVSSLHLSLKFYFQKGTISIEEVVFDRFPSELHNTLGQLSLRDLNDGRIERLSLGQYRIYGLTDLQIATSMEIYTLGHSSTCVVQSLLSSKVLVKVKHGTLSHLFAQVQIKTRTASIIILSLDEESSF